MFLDDGFFALFDGDEGHSVLLSDYRRPLLFDADEGPRESVASRLEATFEAIEAASAQGEWVALAVDYSLGACFDPSMGNLCSGRATLRACVFGQGKVLDKIGQKAFLEERLADLPEHQRVAGVAEIKPSLDEACYADKVEQIRQWITDGDCYQINLTFPLEGNIYGHPLALYASLRSRQPVRYGAFIAVPEETFLSFSPELFFERVEGRVVARPMKGTAPRGATPEEDEANRLVLRTSEKERAENIMIVDLLRNDLGRLASSGSVRVDALCETEAYPTLWQMVSSLSADLPGMKLIDLFRSLFPCGSITGAPKIRAMQRIAELESSSRGLYTGSMGWFAPGGNCRFNVAIRTLEIKTKGRIRLGVGSGIVIDANPAREYAECLLKADFLTGFDPGFQLIETLRLEQGEYPLLDLHLDRLEASALSLGFVCDVEAITSTLDEQKTGRDRGIFRVRLTLDHGGHYQISVSEMTDESRSWRVVLADERLNVDEYLLRHKTTARGRYDRTLAGLAEGVFDAIFLNERGEVCEGARSNVFIERGDCLLTPPASCGLLPGVLRRHLLESGRAVERVLTLDDLYAAKVVYLGNALRGLVPVRLAN